MEKSNAIGMAISGAGDLLISVFGVFIAFCMIDFKKRYASWRLGEIGQFTYACELKR